MLHFLKNVDRFKLKIFQHFYLAKYPAKINYFDLRICYALLSTFRSFYSKNIYSTTTFIKVTQVNKQQR